LQIFHEQRPTRNGGPATVAQIVNFELTED